MSEWISVDDRLPDSGARVILFWMNDYTPPRPRTGMGFYAAKHKISADMWEETEAADYSEEKDEYFCPEGWHEEAWEADYHYPVPNVSHWMPLPPPPEAK